MGNYLFAFKINNTTDRDCVYYVEDSNAHYCCDGRINLHGACFSCSAKKEDFDYEDVTTILSKEEFNRLFEVHTELNFKDSNILYDIIEKLKGEENQRLFLQVQEEEKEFLKEEYRLTDDDITNIWDNYYNDYRDRSIVGCIFESVEELGEEEAFSIGLFCGTDGWAKNIIERHFNFQSFGEELLEESYYLEISKGRVVYLNE